MDSYHMIVIPFMEFYMRTYHRRCRHTAIPTHAHIYLMKIDNRILLDATSIQPKPRWALPYSFRFYYVKWLLLVLQLRPWYPISFHSIIFNTLFKRFDVIKRALTTLLRDKNKRRRNTYESMPQSQSWYVWNDVRVGQRQPHKTADARMRRNRQKAISHWMRVDMAAHQSDRLHDIPTGNWTW